METPTKRLDLVALGALTFEAPDTDKFRCLKLARQALESGGMKPAILNAANEVAVEAFLQQRIGFLQIAELVEETMERAAKGAVSTRWEDLADVLEADAAGRRICAEILASNLLGRVSIVVSERLA
jgi:1-deoxy-D-xylulose-5-phosphate reductoisomerase